MQKRHAFKKLQYINYCNMFNNGYQLNRVALYIVSTGKFRNLYLVNYRIAPKNSPTHLEYSGTNAKLYQPIPKFSL